MPNLLFNLIQDVHHGNGTQEIFEEDQSVCNEAIF